MNKDVFILVPIDGRLRYGEVKNVSPISEAVVKSVNYASNYECDKIIAESIERLSFGGIKLSYMNDEYDMSDIEWLDANLMISYQKQMELGIIQLYVPQCDKDVTQIGDMISSKHAMIKDEERIMTVEEYIKNNFNVEICGKIRTIYCMDRAANDNREIQYMLASEAKASVHSAFKIDNREIEELSNKNLASYDFYDLYASTNSVVYCIDNFSENILENIDEEALLLFICEIAVLQNSALSRINRLIVRELMNDSNISPRKTLKIQVEFGKTILLWDNNIYNYYMAQMLSDKIIEAFETEKLYEEYKRNKQHIEQIAALKSGIASEIEGKVLNILAFVLSINELVQLVIGVKRYILGIPVQYSVIGGTSLAIIIVLVAIIRRRKNKG